MRCLIIGGNGFVGNGLKNLLKDWDVQTVGRSNCDIKYNYAPDEIICFPKVDIIIYAMGKAHDFSSTLNDKSKSMFETNCKKLSNFLSQLSFSKAQPSTFIYISSVSVYGVNKGININENQPLAATDSYGKSKIIAEKIVKKWAIVNNVNCVILRLPLVIGDNPPGNLAKMIKALEKRYFVLFDGGKARKSVVHIENVSEAILKLVGKNGIFNLTDGIDPSFKEIVSYFTNLLKRRKPISIPSFPIRRLLKLLIFFDKRIIVLDNTIDKMTSNLTFSNHKAISELQYTPKPALSYNVHLNN